MNTVTKVSKRRHVTLVSDMRPGDIFVVGLFSGDIFTALSDSHISTGMPRGTILNIAAAEGVMLAYSMKNATVMVLPRYIEAKRVHLEISIKEL